MKKAGLILIFVGAVLVLISAGLFLLSGMRGANARQVRRIELPPGEAVLSEPIKVDPDGLVQLTVKIRVRGDDVRQSDLDQEQAVYHRPLEVEVLAPEDRTIHSESGPVAWDEGWRWNPSTSRQNGGVVTTTEHLLSKFDPPQQGELRVRARLGEDQYDNELESAQLVVYDQAARYTGLVIGGLFSCCAGPTSTAVGLILLIVGLATEHRRDG